MSREGDRTRLYVPRYLDGEQLNGFFQGAAEALRKTVAVLPPDGNLGIQDIAKAARVSPQQIRRLESYGLAKPAYVISGAKRNRRYSLFEAIVLVAAANLMHKYDARPAQAAKLLLGQGIGEN